MAGNRSLLCSVGCSSDRSCWIGWQWAHPLRLGVSKQHKKHVLIVNQNALDLFSCCFLIITFAVQLRDIQFVGAAGYWLCITLISGIFVWWGIVGFVVNLAIITVHRYLKVVHYAWSKKRMRPWMTNTAVAFAWLVGIVANTPYMLRTSGVIDGRHLDSLQKQRG